MDNYKLGVKVSMLTLTINIALTIIKIVAGILGNSSAMLADGIHTLSDVLTTVAVLVGLKISSKKADADHPYGHERYESVFAKLLSLILLGTGLFIGYEAILTLKSGDIPKPDNIALIAAVISIAAKEMMYRYTIITAKKIKSVSMEADAWHHRSDAFSSIGTFIGIFGAKIGFPALDPIAGIVVAAMIIKVGVELYIRSVNQLVDESADDEILEDIRKIADRTDGICGVNDLRTRVFGSRIFVDIDVCVDPEISVKEGHDIATKLYNKLDEEIEDIKDIMIHVEPYCKKKKL